MNNMNNLPGTNWENGYQHGYVVVPQDRIDETMTTPAPETFTQNYQGTGIFEYGFGHNDGSYIIEIGLHVGVFEWCDAGNYVSSVVHGQIMNFVVTNT